MVDDSVRLGINAGPAEAGARRFTAALSRVRAGVQRLGRQSAGAFGALSSNISRGTASFSQFKSAQQGLNFSSTNRSVVGLAGGFRGLENAMSGTFQAASILRVALGTLTLGTITRQIFQAGVQLEKFVITMEAASGTVRGAGEALRFTQNLALGLGQELSSVQEQFSQFAIAADISGMAATQTQSIFKSIATAMTVMGRTADDSRLAFLALQQMLNKSTVMSEELRRQLGERMPGAVQLMAEAVGVSTAELGKMMERGEVISKKALPEFARVVQKRFGPLLEDAFERADVQVRRLTTSITMAQQQIAQAGFMDTLAEAANDLSEILRRPEFLDIADRLGLGLADATRMAADAIIFLADNFDTFLRIAKLLVALSLGATFIKVDGALNLMGANMVFAVAKFGTLLRMLVSGQGLAVSMAGAFQGAGAAARVAAAGTTAFTLALRALAGPVGIILSLLGAAAWVAWPDSAEDGAEATEKWSRILDSFAGSVDEAKNALARLNNEQLNVRLDQSAEAVQIADNAFNIATNRLAALEERIRSVGDTTSGPFRQGVDEVITGAFALQSAFNRGEITAFTFNEQINALADDLPSYNRNLADLIRSLPEVTKETNKAAEATNNLSEARENLRREQFQRRAAEFDPVSVQQLEAIRSEMNSLADVTSEAGANIAEMQGKIERSGLSGFELELAKVRDRFGEVENKLRRTVESLEARAQAGLLGRDQLQRLEEARAALDEFMATEKALARANLGEEQAKQMQKRADAAQDLVDELFPVIAAQAEFQDGMATLADAQQLGIITTHQHAEAVRRLGLEYEDLLDPIGAAQRKLDEENATLRRAVSIMERYENINGETALSISQMVDPTEKLTDAQIRTAAATMKANEAMEQQLEGADPTGFDAFIDSVGTLQEGLENLKQTIAEELTEALAEFATTGKLSIEDLAMTILRELNRVLASQAVAGFLEMFGAGTGTGAGPTGLDRLVGSDTSIGGDLISSLAGAVSSGFAAATTGGFSAGGSTAFIDSIDPEAFSGISLKRGGFSDDGGPTRRVPASTFNSAPNFRSGGLTTDEIPAILHPNEAVVPLGSNRAIPVDLRGGRGQEDKPSTTVSNTFVFPPGTDVDKFKRSRSQIEAGVSTSMNRAVRRDR